jgi:hypothetical protein
MLEQMVHSPHPFCTTLDSSGCDSTPLADQTIRLTGYLAIKLFWHEKNNPDWRANCDTLTDHDEIVAELPEKNFRISATSAPFNWKHDGI